MTLAQAAFVRPEDERNVGELRQRCAERLVHKHLLRRIGDMVVSPYDVRNGHVDVVGDDGQVIRRVLI